MSYQTPDTRHQTTDVSPRELPDALRELGPVETLLWGEVWAAVRKETVAGGAGEEE